MASPNKNMITGKYKHSFEGGYTPYKMLGHELPGPNQRTPNKLSLEVDPLNAEMVDKTSTTPGKYSGGAGSSPAKGWLSNVGKALTGGVGALFGGKKGGGGGAKGLIENLQAKKLEKQQAAWGAGGGTELEARVAALEEAASGGGVGSNVAKPNMNKEWKVAQVDPRKQNIFQGAVGGTGLSV